MGKVRKVQLIILSITLLATTLQTTNYCSESGGKCSKCVRDVTDSSIWRCSKCWKSKLTKEGKCEGTETGIQNCLATGQTFNGEAFVAVTTGDFTPICAQCDQGYHPDLLQANCYNTAEIENCGLEYKISNSGVSIVNCYGCKKGFSLKVRAASTENPNTIECVQGSEISGCQFQGYTSTDCRQCEAGKKKSSFNCEERDGVEGEICFDMFGKGDKGDCMGSGCNSEKGYFATGLDATGLKSQCEKYEGGGGGGGGNGGESAFRGIFYFGVYLVLILWSF